MNKKKITILFLIVFICLITFAVGVFFVFGPNTKNNETVQIIVPREATYSQVLDTLSAHQILQNETTFKAVVKAMRFKTMRVGKYDIHPHTDNYHLVKLLRRGQHYPITFAFNSVRTSDQFVQKVGHHFFFNPEELDSLLHDNTFLKKYQLTEETCPAIFIPNSYQIFYDITAKGFFDRMYKTYQQFWSGKRTEEANAIGLTPIEVTTLASIVEEENYRCKEWAIIAGLYINRLHKGMLLQSDPTVKFALGDFSRQRILNVDLQTDSPYNTYKYAGLPPGPIRMPNGAVVDSVLHYQHNNYLYMCAKEDLSGYHNFTASAAEHEKNARRYRAALQARNIKR